MIVRTTGARPLPRPDRRPSTSPRSRTPIALLPPVARSSPGERTGGLSPSGDTAAGRRPPGPPAEAAGRSVVGAFLRPAPVSFSPPGRMSQPWRKISSLPRVQHVHCHYHGIGWPNGPNKLRIRGGTAMACLGQRLHLSSGLLAQRGWHALEGRPLSLPLTRVTLGPCTPTHVQPVYYPGLDARWCTGPAACLSLLCPPGNCLVAWGPRSGIDPANAAGPRRLRPTAAPHPPTRSSRHRPGKAPQDGPYPLVVVLGGLATARHGRTNGPMLIIFRADLTALRPCSTLPLESSMKPLGCSPRSP